MLSPGLMPHLSAVESGATDLMTPFWYSMPKSSPRKWTGGTVWTRVHGWSHTLISSYRQETGVVGVACECKAKGCCVRV